MKSSNGSIGGNPDTFLRSPCFMSHFYIYHVAGMDGVGDVMREMDHKKFDEQEKCDGIASRTLRTAKSSR